VVTQIERLKLSQLLGQLGGFLTCAKYQHVAPILKRDMLPPPRPLEAPSATACAAVIQGLLPPLAPYGGGQAAPPAPAPLEPAGAPGGALPELPPLRCMFVYLPARMAATVSLREYVFWTGNHMLLWPEQCQTLAAARSESGCFRVQQRSNFLTVCSAGKLGWRQWPRGVGERSHSPKVAVVSAAVVFPVQPAQVAVMV
jgi:hypothetical protein